MAVRHEIEFTITEEGNIEMEVKGVKGKDCMEITKALEEALGVVSNRQYTSEYYQQDVQQTIAVESKKEE
ncbi:MAG: DUF2997 domain-containing protein [Myxococcota bacterium]|jgi:hypothetical protein|nr:DUF2997 domain-containing protein [Myxococcota bacterium]